MSLNFQIARMTRPFICNKFVYLALISFWCVPGHGTENLIQNGDFESPQINADSTANVDPVPWVRIVDLNGGLHHLFNGTPPELNSPSPQSGNQFLPMGHAQGGVHQNFTLNDGGVFQLNWWITSRSEMTGTVYLPYNVRVLDFEDAVITSSSFDAYSSDSQWRQESFQFSAAHGNYKLEFISLSEEYDWEIYLENVQLTAVPEPATYSLLTLGAFLLMRRKKNTS
jgi:hypothetical protein